MATREVVFELPEDTIAALDLLAQTEHRNASDLLNEIVRERVAQAEWDAMVLEGIRQADAGQLISQDELEKEAKNWGR